MKEKLESKIKTFISKKSLLGTSTKMLKSKNKDRTNSRKRGDGDILSYNMNERIQIILAF